MPTSRFLALTCLATALAAADSTALATPAATSGERRTAAGSETSLHSWELPALTVSGEASATLRDADLVGAYQQPRWSTKRRSARCAAT